MRNFGVNGLSWSIAKMLKPQPSIISTEYSSQRHRRVWKFRGPGRHRPPLLPLQKFLTGLLPFIFGSSWSQDPWTPGQRSATDSSRTKAQKSGLILRNVWFDSYAGVVDNEWSVGQLIDSISELNRWWLLEPRDLWWRVTRHYRAVEYHPTRHAHRLSLVFTVKQHLRRHYIRYRAQSSVRKS